MTLYEQETSAESDQELDFSTCITLNFDEEDISYNTIRQRTAQSLNGATNYEHTDVYVQSPVSNFYLEETDLENLCLQLDSVFVKDLIKRPMLDSGFIMAQHTACTAWRRPAYQSYQLGDLRQALVPAYKDMFSSERIYSRDRDGDTLLHAAIILQEHDLSMTFISKALNYDVLSLRNLLFQTPLHLATLTNQPDVVRRLVVAGATLESRDKDGNTALHIACRDGRIKIVEHILSPIRLEEMKQNTYRLPRQKIPQDMSISNYDGLSCLHLAAMNGHRDIIEFLMAKDIDVNLKERKTGRTILHSACLKGDINLVQLLLRHKSCYINARAYDNSTPLDLARARDHESVCMALAAAGAKYDEGYSDSD